VGDTARFAAGFVDVVTVAHGAAVFTHHTTIKPLLRKELLRVWTMSVQHSSGPADVVVHVMRTPSRVQTEEVAAALDQAAGFSVPFTVMAWRLMKRYAILIRICGNQCVV
jgi:hypothetical protein